MARWHTPSTASGGDAATRSISWTAVAETMMCCASGRSPMPMPRGVVMEKASPMAAALVADRPESTAALPIAKPSNSCGVGQAGGSRAA